VKKLTEHALSFVIDEFSHHGEFLNENTDGTVEDEEVWTGSDAGGDSSINNMDVGGDNELINDKLNCSASNSVVDLTMDCDVPSFPSDENINADWCRFGGIRLMQQNKCDILRGEKLNDLIINFVQKLLKRQFPSLKGLQSTLLQSKPPKPTDNASRSASHDQVQVVHCRNDH